MKKKTGCVFYVCCDREKVAIKNIKKLKKCYDYKNYFIIIILQNNNINFKKKIKSIDKNIKIIKKNYDNNFTVHSKVNNNIYTGFLESFKLDVDFAICMEDDLEPGYDLLEFHRCLHNKYKNNIDFGAINSFSKEYKNKKNFYSFNEYFYGVGKGWSINRNTWWKIKEKINLCLNKNYKRFFDIHLELLLRKNFFVIMPYRARILEIPSDGLNIKKKYFISKEYKKELKSYVGNKKFKIKNYYINSEQEFNLRNDCLKINKVNYFYSLILFLLRKIYFKINHLAKSF